MVLVLAGLVVIFGQFRFASTTTYHADFTNISRLKAGQDVRIAGVPVGSVSDVGINGDHVTVAFTVDKRYQLYTSTRAVIRYQDLVGNRYLEITSGPGELLKMPPGATIARSHTQPALDLDALLGGLRPVLKGLDGHKINEISNAILELLDGKGGALADILSSTGAFTQNLAARDHLIGEAITNLDTVLRTVDDKGTQLDTSIDQLQHLVHTLAAGREPIAAALEPLASAETDLTDMLTHSRRPLRGIIEHARPLAGALDDHKDDVNHIIEPLAENYLRLSALGSYGAFFNIYSCSLKIKMNGPAGSDIYLPLGGPSDMATSRCADARK
ncbi:MCE family protein [Candidatus Mycobacterium wuenschmannii]|uniref:MCE family protein n=1 Tax=Candidatus Mycobacterium wuenschmannii TaxID=3027808 RepID=A0ABY8W3G4_9MYCO|nr:MCE family protein [Candidatus Mycobacterium wuenschmannii]WIM90091.1 MCE family protein [Candidatus Mycobacterium wuenschmannii]